MVKALLQSVFLFAIGGVLCWITIPLILAWAPAWQAWLVLSGFSGLQYHIFAPVPYFMVGGLILVTLALASPVVMRKYRTLVWRG